MAPGMAQVHRARHEADRNERERQHPLTFAARRLEAEEERAERDARKDHADAVERTGALAPGLVDEEADKHHPEKADRHVDVEDPAPVRIGDDEAADRRSEDRADERGHEQPGHRRDEIAPLDRAQEHEAPDRHHHRPSEPLKQTRGDEKAERRRQGAKDRARNEDADGRPEHGARAPAIATAPLTGMKTARLMR